MNEQFNKRKEANNHILSVNYHLLRVIPRLAWHAPPSTNWRALSRELCQQSSHVTNVHINSLLPSLVLPLLP
jgi:hypothetical protein